MGSIPGFGRTPGEGNGTLLQYSCLENSMHRRAWSWGSHGVPCGPWSHKELESTEHINAHTHTHNIHTQGHKEDQRFWVHD